MADWTGSAGAKQAAVSADWTVEGRVGLVEKESGSGSVESDAVLLLIGWEIVGYFSHLGLLHLPGRFGVTFMGLGLLRLSRK